MNRIYRVVKNKKTGLWSVASEITRAHGKPKSSVGGAVAAGLSLLLSGHAALAAGPTAVPVDATKAQSYVVPNGATVVDIERANAAGLSHNKYLQFNSSRQGLILNNADGLNNVTVQTQLAGQILANQNLPVSAKVILNEVTANQRSVLQGFLEVAGPKADVVVANPYGITCNGCGFINTDRATLSTGTPIVSPAGLLTGLRVSQGNILVEGNGLDATSTQILDLVSRSVKLDGPVNAKDLGVFVGPMEWSVDTRTPTGVSVTPTDTTDYALDSTTLGGMYANTIRLIANDAGVGVRSLGEVAAASGDFVLTAAGKVELSGRISAKHDVVVQAQSGSAIALTDAAISADHDVNLQADGAITAQGGLLYTNHDLSLRGASLTDESTTNPQLNNNQRFAANTLQVAVTGAASVSQTTWRSGSDMSLTTGSLSTTAAGTRLLAGGNMDLTATTSAMALGQAQIIAQNAMHLQAATVLSTSAGADQIVNAATGNLTLQATALSQAGQMQAETQSQINVATLNNSGTMVLSRQQTPAQTDTVTVSGYMGNSASGTVLSAGDARYDVTSRIENAGTVQSVNNTRISTGVLNNSGQWTLSTDAPAGGVDVVQAGTLNNSVSGVISSNGSAQLSGASLINQGQMLVGHNADVGYTLMQVGPAGLLQAGDALNLHGQSLTLNGAGARVQGAVNGQGDVQITLTQALSNEGQVLSSTSMGIVSPTVTNSATGVVSATQDLTVTATTQVSNAGQVSATNAHLTTPVLSNSGTVSAGQALQIDQNTTLTNTGNVLGQDVSISAQDTTLSGSGLVQASRNLTLDGATLTLDNANAHLQGSLSGAGSVGVTLSGALNNSGVVLSGTTLALQAQQVTNTATGDLSSRGNLNAQITTQLSNQGKIAGDNVTLVAPTFGNDSTGTLAARGQLTLTSTTSLNDQGSIVADAATVQAGAMTVGNTGLLQADKALSITADSLQLSDSGARVLGALSGQGDTALTVSAALSNSATVKSGNTLHVTAPSLTNTATGVLLSSGDMGLNSASSLLNQGQINADNLTITAQNVTNDAGATVVAQSALTYQGGQTLNNQSSILAGSAQIGLSGALTLGTAGLLQTQEDLQVSADALNMGGSATQILGALSGSGTTTLALNQAFNNPGLIYSGHDLSLTAPAITNSTTGGIAADNQLTLNATAGDVTNWGALYSGGDMNVSASGGIYNNITYHLTPGSAAYIQNQVLDTQGTLDAGGNITLQAPTVINSSTIDAAGDITVTADHLYNQVQGGDSRATTGRLDYNASSSSDSWYSFPNKYESTHYTNTWHNDQYFANGNPALRPQITGGGTVTLNGFSSAKNLGGIIQGGTVSVSSTTGGATFLNDDLALIRIDSTETWEHYIKYIALGPLTYTDEDRGYGIATANSTLSTVGANLKANTLNASGFALTNSGSPYAPTVNATTGTGSSNPTAPTIQAGSLPGQTTVQTTNPLNTVNATVGSAPSTVVLPVLDIRLPKNPNGYFVTNRDPSARFLVETNPKFQVGVTTVGSDFLATQLGIDTSLIEKRLGDASYEAYLVKQQLIQQTGSSQLSGYSNFADAMKGMMESAAQQASSLGLSFGQAPTPEQLSQLKGDMVWMVESIVDGEKVLAPMVYLAPTTLASVEKGAVITADKTTLALDSLTNSGGTLGGKDSLTITAKGDITNLSGSIQGGDVSLSSTEGNIVNKTVSQTSGGDVYAATDIGKQASIAATGNLKLDAAGNIENIGAQMAAGGDASLNAGKDIVFDTVANKTTTTTTQVITAGMAAGLETTTTTTTTHVQSGLTVGGNLSAKAGNDITLAGTNANIGGNASLDAGNNLNIVARENTRDTTSRSEVTGLGVGGGVWGTTETTTNSFSSRNLGSTLNIGGNADLSAGQTMTVQGSKVNVGGDTSIAATDVKVLAGKDVDRTTSVTKTTSFLMIEDPTSQSNSGSQSSSGSGSSAGAQASKEDGAVSASARAEASAGAQGSAEAGYQGSAGITLAKTSVTESSSLSQRSVGSELNLGGNVTIKAKKDLTLQGSALNAGGNVDIQADSVNLLAAQNIEQSSTKTTSVSLGLYASTDNNANAQGSADASATAGASASASNQGNKSSAAASVDASAQANAQGTAEASSKNTLDLMRVQVDTQENLNITNTGSAIRSGGNMNIQATNKIKAVGSELAAEGDVNLQAKDMSFEAAQDISYSKTTSSLTTVGLYVDASANADASAKAGAGASAQAEGSRSGAAPSLSASAEASAEAGAEANASAKIGAGLQTKNVTTSLEEGSSTAVTSTIRSGSGSITRKAEGKIKDVGTNIEAAGDLNQSATEIESLAATNSQFSRSSTETTVARVGVYAQADAGASAQASAKAEAEASLRDAEAKASASAGAEASANAKVGVEMSMNRDVSTETRDATQAVVSNIKVGGKVNSQSSGKTTLQGTNIDAGGDINLSADSLDIQAARNTETTTSSNESIAARLAVNIGVGAEAKAKASASTEGGTSMNTETKAGVKVGVEASGSYDRSDSSASSTTAVVSNIGSGGKLNITTKGSTSLEGTNLSGAQGVDITAKDLNFKAAQDTYSSSDSSLSVSAALEAGISIVGNDHSASVEGAVDTSNAQASGTRAVVGSINSGNGVNIRTQGDTRFEGTQINAAGDTTIAAGGNVTFDAARNTDQSSSLSVNAAANAGFTDDGAGFGASGGYSKSQANSSEAVTGSVNTGGSLNISAGKNATFEGTNLAAGGDAQLAAGGNVDFKAARNESFSENSSFQMSLQVGQDQSHNKLNNTDNTTFQASLDVSASYDRERTSTAVTGSLQAGNNLTIVAGNNARFEGTDLAAGNAASVAAGGNVDFVAAESTREAVSTSMSLGLGITSRTSEAAKDDDAGDDKKDAGGAGDKADSKADSKSSAKAGADKAGASKSDDAKSDASDVADKEDEGDEHGAGSSKSKLSGSFGFDAGYSNQSEQKGASLRSGTGGLQVSSGRDVNLQGTQLQTEGSATVAAAGKVNQTAAVSRSTEASIGFDISGESETTTKTNGESETEKKNTSGLRDLSLGSSSSSQQTQINAAGGSSVRGGAAPLSSIPGVSMVLQSTSTADGERQTIIPLPQDLPAGQKVRAQLPNGEELPSWLLFDHASGKLKGKPPADFTGDLNIVIEVPQADGSTRKIGVEFIHQ